MNAKKAGTPKGPGQAVAAVSKEAPTRIDARALPALRTAREGRRSIGRR